MFDGVLGQRVGQARAFERVEAVGRRRPLRLQVEDDVMAVGEGLDPRLVGGGERFEVAQHQRRDVLADGQLDLRHGGADRQPGHQLAQRHEQFGDVRRQVRAGRHVGDVAALPLMEADQHPALLGDETRREPGAEAIAPGRAVDRRVELLGAQAAEVPEVAFKHALLGGHLRRRIEVLHAATAAAAVMRALGRHPVGRGLEDAVGLRDLVVRFAAEAGVFDLLARQRALDENGFALEAGDPACLVVERFDDTDRHAAFLNEKRPLF